ncbi:MAG: hypothetical protein NTV94_13360, partial [Planctomycetota bacterium]|nr:hypothetical protein [Planctomycetota bacterium]
RNDGIGSIRFSGTDSRTSFTMVGGTLGTSDDRPDGFNPGTLIPQIWWDGFYTLTLDGAATGIYDDFESAGFGFAAEQRNTQVIITGMPPGSGSVIVGSPFIRDNTNLGTYDPEGFATGDNGQQLRIVTTGFTRANQGIFIEDGGSVGSINIAGMLFGASVFNGFVDRLAVGNLMGSVTVAGDLGTLVVAADAGIWSPDPGFAFQDGTQIDQNNKTNALMVVGRTAGQILIGGRSQLDVTVVGDVASPTTRPQRDSSVYYELEAYSGAAPGAGTTVGMSAAQSAVVNNAQTSSNLGRTGGQPVVFGSNFLRNDSIMSAEVITSQSGGVRIKGEVSQRDPFNGDDEADVYAFAVNGNETINFQGSITTGLNIGANPASLYFRIVDADGVTVAAPDRPTRSDQFVATNLNFKPNAPGVYYVVVMDPSGSTETGAGSTPYALAISGLATATLGAYRTGAGQGLTDRASGEGSSVTVLSGNIGSIRLGTGYLVGNAETDPVEITNTVQPADDAMSWQGGSISTPGSIYNITTGSDIGQPGANTTGNTSITVTIGGDLGSLITGMSPLFGSGLTSGEGDVNFFTLNVGGRIGSIDIRGGVGMDQDDTADPRAPVGPNSLNIFTGLNGGGGDIGIIKIGFHVAGDSMNVTTPSGTTIGALLVSQAAYNDTNARSGIYLGQQGIRLNTGAGSDVRFADAPRVDLANSVDVVFPLIGGTALDLIDDSGARVQVIIDGPFGQQLGTLIALPIDGSQGVAIASITADLTNGRVLRISSSGTTGVIGIGRMTLTGDGTSQIAISGSVEIDVWRIVDGGAGGGFASITNTTPNGDFVAIDVSGLGTLNVDGDLGRTQVPAYGPQLIGPRLGVATTLQGGVGDALGLQAGLFDTSLAANKIYRAIGDSNTQEGQAALDDVGSPIDGDLNGLVVRAGNVQQVRAKGRLGDVILQGNGAVLQNATANYDIISAFGVFEGLVGTVYAANIVRVDVGDGIAQPDPSPMSTTGVFAANNIGDVTSGRRDGKVVIAGPISASNSQPDNIAGVADGINTIVFTNAQFRSAYIGSQDLDGFWSSFLYGDDNRSRGDIGDVSLTGGTFFSSIIRARDVRTILFTNAFYDASRILATGNLGTVTVQGFRNSTLTGSLDELSTNEISVARDVERITAIGDMNDLVIDVVGRVRGGIFATNISRSSIDVDNQLLTLTATNAIRATSVNVGEVPTVLAKDFYASTFTASGVITTFTATNTIVNTRIEVTGPAAGLGTVLAANGISGSIASSGPITAITSTTGDIDADITTTTSRGSVGTITAGRDLAIRSDVSGNIAGLVAGRNIGTAGKTGVILVRGDLASLSIPTGSLYNDIRVGGAITVGVTVGGTIVKPDNNLVSNGSIIAFGSIKAVVLNGDFDGDIISHSGGITSIAMTNGSFLPGNTIAAYDGSIASVSIVNGNLYGNVHADFDITLLSVAGGVDG